MSDFLKIVQSVKASHGALSSWQKTEFADRLSKLSLIPDLIESSSNDLVEAFSEDSGAPHLPVYDLKLSPQLVSEVLKVAKSLYAQKLYLPVGIVGVINGSQNPFSSAFQKIVSALVLGNSVIWKPSEHLKKTNLLISKLFHQLELPEGVLNIVEGEESIAQSLLLHPAIHYVSFSGSTEAGLKVLAQTSEAGKHIQLSMGARNAAIVFSDVDLKSNISLMAQSFFDFHGLGRLRASRIFVQENFYKSFLEELQNYVSQNDLQYLGAIHQVKVKTQLESAYNQALSEKGKDLLGAKSDQKPKIIYDLTQCSTLQQEEILGPFITISSFKYQFDAVKFANTSSLGRAAYVWSGDVEKASKVARKIEAGRVFLNGLPKVAMPKRYQAAKNSGFGAEGIEDFLDFCSHRPVIE